MTDQNDELKSVFDRLRRDVESTLDPEAARSELERREALTRGGVSRRTRWLAAAAAVVVVVAGGLGIVRWRSTESDVHIGPATTEEPRPTTTTDDCPDRPDVFVYFEPAATDAQIDAARTQLEGEGATSITWYGVEESYAEFRRLFADQPDLVASIQPTDLPRSLRATVSSRTAADELRTALESAPGVLRVENGSELCSRTTVTDDAATTNTSIPVWECTWDEVVDLSAVVPDRFDRVSTEVTGGEPGTQWCARRWGVAGDPAVRITQYLPEIALSGLVPQASDAGFTWGTVGGGYFLRHDEAPQWGVVADGLTDDEWTNLRQALVG